MISIQCQCGSWLPIFPAAIFRPAGYKAVVTGAPANPSALTNFADSCCCAVQCSQLFCVKCCQTLSAEDSQKAVGLNINQTLLWYVRDVYVRVFHYVSCLSLLQMFSLIYIYVTGHYSRFAAP